MTIYILLFLIVFVIQFKIKAKKWDFYDFLLLLILVLMSGLRYGIGTDYYLYSNIYNDSYDLSLMPTNRTGIGFSYLCHYFVEMGLKYENLIMFCSIITIICVYVFLKKYSLRPGLAILIYICLGFYTSSFNGFRQYMSLSLLLIAFIFYRDKKRILSYAFGIISFLIHSSSLFGLLII